MTLNVEVVPGLYYAADSAATIEALKRPGAAEPAKAGDAVVAPKQEGAQGFYKVWVSDGPIGSEPCRVSRENRTAIEGCGSRVRLQCRPLRDSCRAYP